MLAAGLFALLLTGSALAEERRTAANSAPYATDGAGGTALSAVRALQHDGAGLHLPPKQNIAVVGKLELHAGGVPASRAAVEGQIADVSVYKNAAYLMSWGDRESPTTPLQARRLLRRRHQQPGRAAQVAFVPALPETYHGEGAHTITLNTSAFSGDLLAVNNEPCGANGVGGFDLYDVSNPAAPVTLVQGAGDRSPDGSLEQDPAEVPNSAHSIFVWQDGARAFASSSTTSSWPTWTSSRSRTRGIPT